VLLRQYLAADIQEQGHLQAWVLPSRVKRTLATQTLDHREYHLQMQAEALPQLVLACLHG